MVNIDDCNLQPRPLFAGRGYYVRHQPLPQGKRLSFCLAYQNCFFSLCGFHSDNILIYGIENFLNDSKMYVPSFDKVVSLLLKYARVVYHFTN